MQPKSGHKMSEIKVFFKEIKIKSANSINVNRMIYVALLLAIGVFAFISGERVLYITVSVLFILPLISLLLTYVALRRLWVKQNVSSTIVKNYRETLVVRIHNDSILPFTNVECVFFSNEHAIRTINETGDIGEHEFKLTLRPLATAMYEIPFYTRYRGLYNIGVERVNVTDFMGLFCLSHTHDKHAEIISLPRILDFSNVPLALDVIAEASSRFDIKDEDYSTISDIRAYLPTDSIKRVHWKLTAKRNEWLVKIFQANAINSMSIVLDCKRTLAPSNEMYALEDLIVEYSLGLARHCLKKGMPVDFIATDGSKARAHSITGFDSMYKLCGRLMFENEPALDPVSVLTHVLNDSSSYVNAVICTSSLTVELYERFVHAINKGNYAAIMYFPTNEPNTECERIFNLMEEGGQPCFRITPEVMYDVV